MFNVLVHGTRTVDRLKEDEEAQTEDFKSEKSKNLVFFLLVQLHWCPTHSHLLHLEEGMNKFDAYHPNKPSFSGIYIALRRYVCTGE